MGEEIDMSRLICVLGNELVAGFLCLLALDSDIFPLFFSFFRFIHVLEGHFLHYCVMFMLIIFEFSGQPEACDSRPTPEGRSEHRSHPAQSPIGFEMFTFRTSCQLVITSPLTKKHC